MGSQLFCAMRHMFKWNMGKAPNAHFCVYFLCTSCFVESKRHSTLFRAPHLVHVPLVEKPDLIEWYYALIVLHVLLYIYIITNLKGYWHTDQRMRSLLNKYPTEAKFCKYVSSYFICQMAITFMTLRNKHICHGK